MHKLNYFITVFHT